MQNHFVETIGNATEEVILKYVQDQLKIMDKSEKTRSLAAEFFIGGRHLQRVEQIDIHRD